MKLVVTVLEETCDATVQAIRNIDREHDMVEVRAERFPDLELDAIRAATAKPIILTFRNCQGASDASSNDTLRDGTTPHPAYGHPLPGAGRGATNADPGETHVDCPSPLVRGEGARRADEGSSRGSTWASDPFAARDHRIDFIDIEWREGITIDDPARTVISHHDYEGMRDVEAIMAKMRALGCAYTKLAASPQNFADNERLLNLLPGTVIGMGERGLYSRILAPFRGSELAFVAATNLAAPGQLTLARALDIYSREPQRAERVFAVVGNPAGHSLSPVIHNRLFREKGVPAAYTIASIERFDEIAGAFRRGEPCGLSVTTPFKEDALRVEAEVGENARRARAVNTLVNIDGHIIADNTDVDGFAALIPNASKAAVLGAGPTARAALVALEDKRIAATIYNRGNMDSLRHFDGDLIINTLPAGAEVVIPRCGTYIEAAYSGAPKHVDAERRISGLELLHAQAVGQHQLFMKVFDGV